MNNTYIYDMRTSHMTNPLGIDIAPTFSWKTYSDRRCAAQTAYSIDVASDADFSRIVWQSGRVETDESIAVPCGGKLQPTTRYYWRVTLWDECGGEYSSDTAWFETGLRSDSKDAWSGAQWITSPDFAMNADMLDTFAVHAEFEVRKGSTVGIVVCARNKDDYVLVETDVFARTVTVTEYASNAWSDGVPRAAVLGKFDLPASVIPEGTERSIHAITVRLRGFMPPPPKGMTIDRNKPRKRPMPMGARDLTVTLDGTEVIDEAAGKGIFAPNKPHEPRKHYMMLIGAKQERGAVVYKHIHVTGMMFDDTIVEDDFHDNSGVLSALGEATPEGLLVEDRFELVSVLPPYNFIRTFNVEKPVKSARLYASARGFYKAHINGTDAGNTYYAPGFTDYRKRILYQTYDVTDLIKEGANTVGAVVAKGYYTGFCGYSGANIYGRENSFIAKLVITYSDGSEDIIVTDRRFLYSPCGALLNADYLDGEYYDARLELGLTSETLDLSKWRAAGLSPWSETVRPTNGMLTDEPFLLTADNYEPARVERVLTPICEPVRFPGGRYVYDFGQNISGIVRIKVTGKRGAAVKIHFGEMCRKDGGIYLANLRSAANTDVYVLKGAPEGEVFSPRFTSHGFRYAEISGSGCGLDKSIVINSVEALVISNVRGETGEFECSNSLINKLHENTVWSQRDNYLLVPTDCPQRNERMGWTGDAQVFAATGAFNIESFAFMRKWLTDLRDAQLMYNLDGAVPDTAPLGGDNRPTGGCGGWGDAAVIVPWKLYTAYGDISILAENYDMMKKWVDYQARPERRGSGMRTVDGNEVPEQSELADIAYIQCQQSRGDHLAFDESTPFILSATAYAAHSADLLAQTAEILGASDDAAHYRKLFENIKQAFNSAWVQPDGTLAYHGEMSKSVRDKNGEVINKTFYSNASGSRNIPSQTAYALAIDFGLIPEGKLVNAAKAFQQAIDEYGGLSVGFLGVSHLAQALEKAGLTDTAFELLENREQPSWLYEVINGATTIWERWNSYCAETDTFADASMNSFNHYAYGAVCDFLHKTILGIRPAAAGYKRIELVPTYGSSITSAKGALESPYGRIESEWNIEGDTFYYRCKIPANTTARLYMPNSTGSIELDAGEYAFKSTI